MCQFWLVKGTAVSYFLSYLHIFAQCQTFFVEFTLYFFIQACLYLHSAIFTYVSVISMQRIQKYHISCPIIILLPNVRHFLLSSLKRHFFFYLHSAIFTHAKNSKSSLDKKFKECVSVMPRLMSLGLMAFQELLSMWIKLSSCVSKIAFSTGLGIFQITRFSSNNKNCFVIWCRCCPTYS